MVEGGGGGLKIVPEFKGGRHEKKPLPETDLTKPLVEFVEFPARLSIM